MTKFADLVWCDTATTGTSDIAVGSALTGFLTPALAGVSNGDTVTYSLTDGNNREVGHGTYSSTGPTITRTTVLASTNSGSKISLSGSAIVSLTVSAADLAAMAGGGSALSVAVPSTPAAGSVQLYALAPMIPQMTGYTTPSGTASASSEYTGDSPNHHLAWAAFAALSLNPNFLGWLTSFSSTGWLQYQFGSAKTALVYTIEPWWIDTWNGRVPTAWTFKGSNDGSSWTTLDTQSVHSGVWQTSTPRAFVIASPGSYAYYRLDISANNGNTFVGVHKLQLYGVGTPVSGEAILLMSIDENGLKTPVKLQT